MPTGESVEQVREKSELIDAEGLRRLITRIAHEIIERNGGAENVVLVGIRRRGYPLAQRIAAKIRDLMEDIAPDVPEYDEDESRDDG